MEIKKYITIAVFASLWSCSELFLGAFLHTFSLSAIPFINPTGLIMLFFALCIMTVLEKQYPVFPVLTTAALLTAVVKLFGYANVKIVPSAAILCEGFLFDILLHTFRMNRRNILYISAAVIVGMTGTGFFSLIGYFFMGWFKGKTIYFVFILFTVSSVKGAAGALLGCITGLKINKQLND